MHFIKWIETNTGFIRFTIVTSGTFCEQGNGISGSVIGEKFLEYFNYYLFCGTNPRPYYVVQNKKTAFTKTGHIYSRFLPLFNKVCILKFEIKKDLEGQNNMI